MRAAWIGIAASWVGPSRRRAITIGPTSLIALALLSFLGACRGPQTSPAPESSATVVAQPQPTATISSSASVAPPAASVAQAPTLAPLLEPTPLVALAVPGFRDAVVSVPIGASSPRVVALALHGNFDRPEWQCEVWRRITRGEVFVLCPRGTPRSDVPQELDRWEWGSVAKTKSEMLAALTALRARYPDYVQGGPVVFTGFSLGAILGARLIQDPELNVGAAVLIEGGYQGWTVAKAKALKPRLGRLLFACGQSECRNAYRYQLERLFTAAGVPSSLVADVKAGHTYDDPVAALVQSEWAAILASLKAE
jgi:dienelactone hydrolase